MFTKEQRDHAEQQLRKPLNDEIGRLRAENAELREALTDVHRFFASHLDPADDQESWEWLCWLKVKQALAKSD